MVRKTKKNLVIPLINIEHQINIAEKTKASFKLKAKSKPILNLTKQAVEVVIEQNEEQAILLIEVYEG